MQSRDSDVYARKFDEALILLYKGNDRRRSFEAIDSLLLEGDRTYEHYLLGEGLIHLADGEWTLTPRGKALAEALLLIRESRLYMKLIPIVCMVSLFLAIFSLIF